MKLKPLLIAASLALIAPLSYAGGFVELPTSGVLRVVGAANPAADQLYLQTPNLTLLQSLEYVVTLSGEEIGSFTDAVYRDNSDNKLVFGSRLTLDEDGEINDIFRSGFTGYSAAAAWTFTTDFDLRLYSAARTATGLKQGADVFSPDVIDLRSDINLEEGNPWTALYLIKTDAPNYAFTANAIRLRQGGEEGQPVTESILGGWAPAAATPPVPEPSTYAVMIGGLGLMGFVAWRRRNGRKA